MNISIAKGVDGNQRQAEENVVGKEYTLPRAYLSIVRQCNTFFSQSPGLNE